jgi:hypothetical protein
VTTFVEVEYTGVTIGTVLQMTFEVVDWLVSTVEEVTSEVLVLVLVTKGGGLVFWSVWIIFGNFTNRHKRL